MKKERLGFSDIIDAVDGIHENPNVPLANIYRLEMPARLRETSFDYGSRDRHSLFHEVLNDLDALVKEGLAARSMERAAESELEEVFVITPEGIGRVGALIVELQGGDFKVVG